MIEMQKVILEIRGMEISLNLEVDVERGYIFIGEATLVRENVLSTEEANKTLEVIRCGSLGD